MRKVLKLLVFVGVATVGVVGGMVTQSVVGVKKREIHEKVVVFRTENGKEVKQNLNNVVVGYEKKLDNLVDVERRELSNLFDGFKWKVQKAVEDAGVDVRKKFLELIHKYHANKDEKTFVEMKKEIDKCFDDLEIQVGKIWTEVSQGLDSKLVEAKKKFENELKTFEGELRKVEAEVKQ
jgi:SMC interacting uncharacterized protein involved in chromosome segregation